MRDAMKLSGGALIIISLFGMLMIHEFMLSSISFIGGSLLVGYAYATIPNKGKSTINTKQVNENIQTLNEALWGKEKPAPTPKLMTETDWQITVQEGCRDIRHQQGPAYCVYGGKRGYCTFGQCPRRKK